VLALLLLLQDCQAALQAPPKPAYAGCRCCCRRCFLQLHLLLLVLMMLLVLQLFGQQGV
jgi:hypothetical protein